MCIRDRLKPTLQYVVNIKVNFDNLAYSCVLHRSLYDKNKVYKNQFDRVPKHVEDSNLPLDIIHHFNNFKIPPSIGID